VFPRLAKQVIAVFILSVISVCAQCAYGDAPVRLDDVASPRPFAVIPAATAPPLVTADPKDSAWKSAVSLPLANISSPKLYRQADSSVKVLWDNKNLYLRYQATDNRIPYRPYSNSSGRLWFDDSVEALIDFEGDSQHWVEIIATPEDDQFVVQTNLKEDSESDVKFRLTKDSISKKSISNVVLSPNAIKTASRLTSNGWIVDICIPAADISQASSVHSFSADSAIRANFIRLHWVCSNLSTGKMDVAQLAWSSFQPNDEQFSPQSMGYLQFSDKTVSDTGKAVP